MVKGMSPHPSVVVHQQHLLCQGELKSGQGLGIIVMCPLDTPVFALPLNHIRLSSDVVKSHGNERSLFQTERAPLCYNQSLPSVVRVRCSHWADTPLRKKLAAKATIGETEPVFQKGEKEKKFAVSIIMFVVMQALCCEFRGF